MLVHTNRDVAARNCVVTQNLGVKLTGELELYEEWFTHSIKNVMDFCLYVSKILRLGGTCFEVNMQCKPMAPSCH